MKESKTKQPRKRHLVPFLISERFEETWEKFLRLKPASLSQNAWICYAIEKVVNEAKK